MAYGLSTLEEVAQRGVGGDGSQHFHKDSPNGYWFESP